ncbi:MAG: hypothetical protein ACREYE_03075, partial [Gammaproteobacteria bacterium]
SGGARNPHVFQYTLRFLRSGGTRPSFARDGFSQTLRADGPESIAVVLLRLRTNWTFDNSNAPFLFRYGRFRRTSFSKYPVNR